MIFSISLEFGLVLSRSQEVCLGLSRSLKFCFFVYVPVFY
jgi:hypothetical protein